MVSQFDAYAPPAVDAVDRHILDILLSEGRASVAAISDRVGITPPSVSSRLANLEASGVIEGYAAQLNYTRLGFETTAIFRISVDGGALAAVSESILHYPTITDLFSVAGPYDLLVVGRVRDLEALRVLDYELSTLDGVAHVATELVLETHAHNRPFQRLPVGATVGHSWLEHEPRGERFEL